MSIAISIFRPLDDWEIVANFLMPSLFYELDKIN